MRVKSMYGEVEIELGMRYKETNLDGETETWELLEIRSENLPPSVWDSKGSPAVVCRPVPRSGYTTSFMGADWFVHLMFKSLEDEGAI